MQRQEQEQPPVDVENDVAARPAGQEGRDHQEERDHRQGAVDRLAAQAALALAVGWLVLEAPRWLPVLRRADVPGAILLGGALGCVVLTFAAADPAREVVGPLGWVLLPLGLALAVLYAWRARRVPAPLVPSASPGRPLSPTWAWPVPGRC